MIDDPRRARDLTLLDALDRFGRERFAGPVWRVTRGGRDPLLASPSNSRWCNGTFDVLYSSLERSGAIAEMYAMLALQPVFPSVPVWLVYKLDVTADKTLKIADLSTLGHLGVNVAGHTGRDYSRTQAIADAAYFLGFDGLIAPSARWDCQNAMLFPDRIAPVQIALAYSAGEQIDWSQWRKDHRK